MPLPAITNDRTPRHALPNLYPAQAQKEAFVNEAFARIDALLQPLILGELAAPPADPAPGASYIVTGPARGAWTTHEGSIATWAQNQWLFAVPAEGARVHDASAGSLAVFNGSDGWQRASAPSLPSDGSVMDTELREAVAEIVAKLHRLGIFSA